MKYSELSRLPDRQLLARTERLVQQERDHNIVIIDHLREIRERGLYLARGYSSLFQYAVKALRYSDGAAYRRLQTLKLCTRHPELERQLRSGELNLTTAAQLQTAIEREQKGRRRGQRRPPAAAPDGREGRTGPPAASRARVSGDAAGAVAPHGVRRQPASRPQAASAPRTAAQPEFSHRDLIEQAAGRSSRDVARLIADRNPEASLPRERLRSLGGGHWELRAVIDDSSHEGLEQLRALLAHVDPALSYGELLARLVADGLRKYDPRRQKGRAAPAGSRPGDKRPAGNRAAGNRAPARAAAAAPRRTANANGVSPAPGSESAPKRGHAAALAAADPGPERHVTSPANSPPPPAIACARHVGPSPPGASAPDGATGALRSHPASAPKCAATDANRAGSGGGAGPRRPGAESSHRDPATADAAPAPPTGHVVVVRRAIPAALRRAVWRRDDGACTFVDPQTGRRCGSRHLLQIDHIQPFAVGGANSAENLRLLCGAHNRYRTRRHSARGGPGAGQALP